jgi:hypothetical protein
VAYNPSLSPMHAFAVTLWACGRNFDEVEAIVFLEKKIEDNNTYVSD